MSVSPSFRPRCLPHLAAAALIALAARPSTAQLPRPANWRVLVDGAVRDTVHYVQMPPGWHITTGPGSLLFDPAYQAAGRYAVEIEVFLFPGTSQSGYGVFVGGSALDGAQPSYLAFVARRDGHASLERVTGGTRTAVLPWAPNAAVKAHPGGDEPVKNVLRLSVERDSVVLEANGVRVAAVPRGDLALDGVFGFRAGPDVNLHASRLDHTRRLAPAPAPRAK